ncbi:MAG: ABC transporter ATP-binding protein [Deltaproteobacteria bacterium]|jgi:iron complex transport system ATP-binding protein|nr:ABC transporter ATP-binding protein [Deltaproteobacteria bacterium]
MTALIEVRDFSLSFDQTPVLSHLDFSLEKGRYLSILGPNGAGKSTLLKCLPRLHENARTSGEIRLAGRPLQSWPQKELARLLGYVPQAGGWIPPYTVREFLLLSRYPHPDRSRDLKALARALELTGLGPWRDRTLSTLSGGERQKAYLAAALAQETEVLLLDEPSSFLDPHHAAALDELLIDLHAREGLTVITVTHDLNHPAKTGGLGLVLKGGALEYFGPAENLFSGGILEAAFDHRFVYLDHPDGRKVAVP